MGSSRGQDPLTPKGGLEGQQKAHTTPDAAHAATGGLSQTEVDPASSEPSGISVSPRGLTIDRPIRIGVTVTFIRLRHGFAYLVAIMDW